MDLNQALKTFGDGGVGVPSLSLTGAFTIETWIYFEPGTTIDNKDGIVSSGTGKDGNDLNFFDGKLRLYHNAPDERRADHVVANTAVTAGAWTHVAVTRDGAGNLSVYLNGVLDATSATPWTGAFNVDELGSAARGKSSAAEFDNLRIWSVERSGAEIAADMGSTQPSNTTGLERNYSFEGTSIVDQTGSTAPVPVPADVALVTSTAPVDGAPQGNIAPNAVDDSVGTIVNTAIVANVLANDSDVDGTLDPASVTVTSAASNGTTSVNPTTGAITYTPDTGFIGQDSFVYSVSDDDADSDTAVVSVNVGSGQNTPPTAVNDSASTTEGNAVVANVLANDSDVDGTLDPATVTVTSAASNGTTSVNPTTGAITYTPDTGFTGQDSFVYSVADDDADSDTATVTITVNPQSSGGNQALKTFGDGGVGVPSLSLTGAFTIETWIYFEPGTTIDNKDGIVSSGTGKDGNDLNFFDGKLRLYHNAPGEPRADHVVANTAVTAGAWTHVAVTRDGAGNLSVYLNGVLDATSATPWTGAFNVDELGSAARGKSSAAEFDNLRIWSVERSGAEIAADMGSTQPSNTTGLERNYSFEGTSIVDQTGSTAPVPVPADVALVTSTAPVDGAPQGNIAPNAVDDSVGTIVNTAIVANVLANDSDVDGTLDPASVTVTSAASNGTTSVNPTTGAITYTPDTGFIGQDSFVYSVSDDDADSDTAVVSVNVGSGQNTPPTAVNDSASTTEGNAVVANVLANDSDVDGTLDPATVTVTSAASNGTTSVNPTTGAITYTPDTGFTGQDSFVYSVADDDADSDTATVTITVNPQSSGGNQALQSTNGQGGVEIGGLVLDEPFTIEAWVYLEPGETIDDRDGIVGGGRNTAGTQITFEGGRLTLSNTIASGPTGDLITANTAATAGQWTHYAVTRSIDGTLNLYVDGVLDATAAAGWTGPMIIAEIGRPISGATEGQIDSLRIWSTERSAAEILANFDADVDPSSPNLERSYTFDGSTTQIIDETGHEAPIALPSQADIVQTSGLTIASATPLVNVPLAGDDYFGVLENSSLIPLAVLANDSDPEDQAISINSFSTPTNGTLQEIDGKLYYTPNVGYFGTDSFTYVATDGSNVSATATAHINVVKNHAQPQSTVNTNISPNIESSDVTLTLTKVVQIPLTAAGKQPRVDTMELFGDRMFVTVEGENAGEAKIYELVDDGNGGLDAVVFFDVNPGVQAATGRDLDHSNKFHGGLRGVAFHPEFDTNGKFYTSVMEERPASTTGHTYLGAPISDPIDADSVLIEWTYDFVAGGVDLNSYREVFRVEMPRYDHPIKDIKFDPNAQPGDADYGLLYVTHGDGSEQSAIAGGGQGNDALGKIIRIDPLEDGSNPYSVPASNPFVGDPNMLDEVYALGFRNPHNLSFADLGGGQSQLIISDAGRDNAEEVNLVVAGGNYGWSLREGPLDHTGNNVVTGVAPLPANEASLGLIYPATFYGHDGEIGETFISQAIAGGHVIQNGTALDDTFIFGDFPSTGRIFGANFTDMRNAVTLLDPNDPTRDEPDELSWAEPFEIQLLFDHDDDPLTDPIAMRSFTDILNEEPDFLNVLSFAGDPRADLRFGEGADGELYLLNKRNGWIYLAEDTMPDDFIF